MLSVGETVGNYRITALIGEGGMGMVYAALHPAIGRRAAVKILHASLAENQEMVSRFFNEARAANAIRHPGIVEVFDFGTLTNGAPYIVMEFLEGESLSSRLRRAGAMAPAVARIVVAQAAAALGAAHAAGIVHRDLKPDNLFLCPDFQVRGAEVVKVLDFGIAKLGAGANQIGSVKTRTGTVMGTPAYMSPEQCLGTREVDLRSDIYSLGVILYELVCGRPPFVTEGFGEMVHLHISAPPMAPRVLNPALPADLEGIILRALAKSPGERFQSMAELHAALTSTAPASLAATQVASAVPLAGNTLQLDQPLPRGGPQLKGPLGPPTTFSGAANELSTSLRPRSRLGPLAGVALAVALAAGGFVVWRQQTAHPVGAGKGSTTEESRKAEPSSVSATRLAAEPLAEPPTIEARISSEPSGARVIRERDGAVLGITPLEETWPKESGTELLRLELAGYHAEQISVPLDRGVRLSLPLRKIDEPATRKAAATPAHAPASSKRPPAGGHKRPASPKHGQPQAEPEPEAI